ncbi:MAG: cell division protein ZapA, partial [Boseongicola sp.]
RGLLRQFGQMSEGRLLLMTALMVADRLAEADDKSYQVEQQLIQAQKQAENGGTSSDMFSSQRERDLTDRVNALVAQIENMGGQERAMND